MLKYLKTQESITSKLELVDLLIFISIKIYSEIFKNGGLFLVFMKETFHTFKTYLNP